MRFFLLIQYFIVLANAYKLFNHWSCIGILDKIDFSKPYVSNIGELPLVSWKNPISNKIVTTINICKHMGSQLGNAKITKKGGLQCQYHGLEMTNADSFGETVEHEGKLFWAYEPTQKIPYKTPFYKNPEYETSFLEIDMEGSLIDSALNTMDVRHPEYVHNKLLGFGSSIAPTNIKQYKYDDGVGLAFDYQPNKLMQSLNNNVEVTKNFHMFMYPSFTWSKVSILKKNLIISVNMLPLTPNKTRWYVTISHNYYKSEIQKKFMKVLATSILSQDYVQMRNQYEENSLKKTLLFGHTFPDEEVITWLYKMFQDSYEYPSIEVCTKLYEEHKKKIE
jgi:phenylpropionate dioxygenase-like ring-hydroxylating dioxygenase large terminal subunit